jgi:hypothetical protein
MRESNTEGCCGVLKIRRLQSQDSDRGRTEGVVVWRRAFGGERLAASVWRRAFGGERLAASVAATPPSRALPVATSGTGEPYVRCRRHVTPGCRQRT